MYVNSPGGSVTAGNNTLLAYLFPYDQLKFLFCILFFLSRFSLLTTLVSLTLPRHGYL